MGARYGVGASPALNAWPLEWAHEHRLELFDANNVRVAQAVSDAVTVTRKGSATVYFVTPRELPPGRYTLDVGIFTPRWKKHITWYDGVAAFTISGPVSSHPSLLTQKR